MSRRIEHTAWCNKEAAQKSFQKLPFNQQVIEAYKSAKTPKEKAAIRITLKALGETPPDEEAADAMAAIKESLGELPPGIEWTGDSYLCVLCEQMLANASAVHGHLRAHKHIEAVAAREEALEKQEAAAAAAESE